MKSDLKKELGKITSKTLAHAKSKALKVVRDNMKQKRNSAMRDSEQRMSGTNIFN